MHNLLSYQHHPVIKRIKDGARSRDQQKISSCLSLCFTWHGVLNTRTSNHAVCELSNRGAIFARFRDRGSIVHVYTIHSFSLALPAFFFPIRLLLEVGKGSGANNTLSVTVADVHRKLES